MDSNICSMVCVNVLCFEIYIQCNSLHIPYTYVMNQNLLRSSLVAHLHGVGQAGGKGYIPESIHGSGWMVRLGLIKTVVDFQNGLSIVKMIGIRITGGAMISQNACISFTTGGIKPDVMIASFTSVNSNQATQRPPTVSKRTILATASIFIWTFRWIDSRVQMLQALR